MRFSRYMLIFLVICTHVLPNNAFIPSLEQDRVGCHNHEKAALLQHKQKFLIDCDASTPPFAYPKMNSWHEHTVGDCCNWDGVVCDKETNFVIGIDLSSSCLYGKFPTNSTLFSLDHLTDLNLADNNFSYSPIPSSIAQLSKLKSLNLSDSYLSGLIPSSLSLLSSLTILDLSYNGDTRSNGLYYLVFGEHSLDKLLTNLTRLTQLHLDTVDISSSVIPPVLSNMSSLTSLSLVDCDLYGEVPQGLFQLPHLEKLDLSDNQGLQGHLPHIHSPLIVLDLQETGFSGELPSSIAKLGRLKKLYLNDCSFSGVIPASLANLTELTTLSLALNEFSGTMPFSLTNLTNLEHFSLSDFDVSPMVLDSWLLNLNKLTDLWLVNMNMGSKIPSSLANLTRLTKLDFEDNQLFGTLPQWFANLTQLTELSLSNNQLEGPVQPWLSKLVNLHLLDLSNNNFVGMFDDVFELPKLRELWLGNLNLTFLPEASTNSSSLAKLTVLDLSSCNLNEIPQILRYQNELKYLSLDGNNLGGRVPQWFMDTNKDSLLYLSLSDNSLVGFEHPRVSVPWTNLQGLNLRGNKLRGSLPIPVNTMQVFDMSNNCMHGAIPEQICLANSLIILDLSNNSMTGRIPHCIGHRLGSSLQVLNLRGNNFSGTVPQRFHKLCSLKMINLSENKLDGQLPRSLANCKMLEVLDIGKNRVNDTFPSWLETLPALQVLVLRHNNFHGKIHDDPKSSEAFGRLRIIDLSHNFHVGTLPAKYLQGWRAIQVSIEEHSSSSNSIISIGFMFSGTLYIITYKSNYVITITNKGSETLYPRILTVFRVVDFSSNNFTGKIPIFLGNLGGLQALNLSNNYLQGDIPSSLSKISDLQALDLSQNMLSGVIPHELSKLTFLEVFNVSHNRLVGPIPQGEQFDTFDNTSFDGNLALCGSPLSKRCGIVLPPPGIPSQQETEGDMIGWVIRALGCASGLIVGFVIGKLYITDKYHVWFINTFTLKRKTKARGRKTSNCKMNH